ncbi:MAG: hypothetical protein J6L88_06765, partial [Clostridia bacterium]|nr:hypothetical protein [Clostridia bacterium]
TQYTTTEPNENGWMNEHFVITSDEGYQISTVNTDEGPWEDTLYDVMQTDSGSMTFYLRNEQTGLISRAGEVSYKVDYTNPAGQLDFVDRAFWQEFLNHITFDLFYRDEVIVRVEAMDDLSGVASVEYASADRAMTLEEVKAITDWRMYENSFGVSVEDAKRFVYFVRITDLAGNVTYISSDGAEYDTTAPEIRGIADGATYYTTRQVTASDRNLDTVRCNEADVASDFTIAGDVDAVYTITASDRAGNQTTVSVTMLPISTLAEKIDGLTTETVKSSDAPAVQAVLQAADTVDPDSATDEEKQAISEILDRAQGLDDVIDDVQEQMQRIDRQADGYDESTVNSDDKAALQQLLKDIEVLTDGDNLTDDERAQLNETAKKLEGMLAAIDEAADAADTEHTDKVQDVTADNVTAEDRDDLEQAKDDLTQALQQQGDHYTDEEKKAIEADIDRIDDALDALDRADGVRQLIDSLPETITKEDADAVKAADDAYNALSTHERDLVGAQAQKTLEDTKAALEALNVPKTGDDSNPAVWIVHLFVSISAICALYLAGKRRKSMN